MPNQSAGHTLFLRGSPMVHEARRAALLKHFEEEAERLEDFPLHILADIDQTVFVGTFGAGAAWNRGFRTGVRTGGTG